MKLNKKTFTEIAIEKTPEIFSWDWKKKSLNARAYLQTLKPKRMIFVGTGSSYHAALWACWASGELNLKNEVIGITSWELLAGRMTPLKDDLLVFISHRGKKGLTEKLCHMFKKNPHILISAKKSLQDSFPIIETVDEERANSHTISLMGAMTASLQVIAECSQSKATENKIKNILKETHSILNKTSAEQIKFPKGETLFVGAGIFSPVALECALKAKEMGRLRSSGFLLEEFLHGPSIALKPKDLVVFFNVKVIQNRFLWDERVQKLKAHCRNSKAKLILLTPNKTRSPIVLTFLALFKMQKALLNQSLRLGENPDVNPHEIHAMSVK